MYKDNICLRHYGALVYVVFMLISRNFHTPLPSYSFGKYSYIFRASCLELSIFHGGWGGVWFKELVVFRKA